MPRLTVFVAIDLAHLTKPCLPEKTFSGISGECLVVAVWTRVPRSMRGHLPGHNCSAATSISSELLCDLGGITCLATAYFNFD